MHFKYTTDRLELSETRSSIIMNDNAAVDHFPRAKWARLLQRPGAETGQLYIKPRLHEQILFDKFHMSKIFCLCR